MEKNDYPHASEIRQIFADKLQEQKALEEQQQQLAQLQQLGGGNGYVPQM